MTLNNIEILEETLHVFERGYSAANGRRVGLRLSAEERAQAKVFLPRDIDKLKTNFREKNDIDPEAQLSACSYECRNEDSFAPVLREPEGPKWLVLNFANAVHIGGGVRRGAQAQEEDLCRRSSLLLSLESKNAAPYYEYNRALNTHMGSDAVIVSPKVEIIRGADGELLKTGVICAVMTCAAPCIIYGTEGMSAAEYRAMFFRRILGMLTVAAACGYRRLVLGAFGCGAFRNDASLVADLFARALREIRLDGKKADELFEKISFAVLSRSPDQYNFRQFYRNFGENRFPGQGWVNREGLADVARGCLLGGAAGDALGYTVEFLSEPAIFSRWGKDGIQSYEIDALCNKAIFSDDTQMTLFTANGILVGSTRHDLHGIGAMPRRYVAMAYRDWLATQEQDFSRRETQERRDPFRPNSWLCDVPELWHCRAPGNTCLSGLHIRSEEVYPEDFIASPINSSKGCGGVMRAAPMGFLPWDDIRAVDFEAAQIAAITHSHPGGWLPAAMLAHIIHRIAFPPRRDMTLLEIVLDARDTVAEVFPEYPETEEFTALIDRAIALSAEPGSDLDHIHELGEGWVGDEAMAIAVYCALKHEHDFSAGIIAAVNHRGDSDSTGAIAGNILGAIAGYDGIDDKWKNDLEITDVILGIADDLARCSRSDGADTPDDPAWVRKYVKMRR
ncbi:MAG: TIGR02452 family protein [Clostridia bacterium]|nr:TIGR02452 family protein [Clostridia bacterium]